MTRRAVLRSLRTALLALYDNPLTIRRLVDDAGVDVGQITLYGAPEDIWYSVITETERQSKIDALLNAVDQRYQNNQALQQAYQAYRQEQLKGGVDVVKATAVDSLNIPDAADSVAKSSNEKAAPEDNKQRIEHILSTRRTLWPLKWSDDGNMPFDANYDFPLLPEKIDDCATHAVYFRQLADDTASFSPFEFCRDYLSHYNHHIVTGHRGAGKSWLRLYLEYFSCTTEEKLLPLFYFAPASLAFETTVVEIVENLARSVANQLFVDLLSRSHNRMTTYDPWQISRTAITPFLWRYGYTVLGNRDSLAQPIPPNELLDVALAYADGLSSAVYAQMKQEIDTLGFPARTEKVPVAEILDDIQHAIELVGYQSLFVMVDNWGNLPPLPRRRLLQYLLQSDLLVQLYQRRIFLKLFMPEIPNAPFTYFDESCKVKREASPQLTLYTYRDTHGESKPF